MSDHDHDHSHTPITNGGEPAAAARVRALEELLVERGVIGREEVRERIDWLVSRSPADGARLVARAWVDPAFKGRLLADARAAALELGLDPGPSPVVVAVENTQAVHHMVVCTLCSCYPKALLGPPPDWYKSLPYRSRAVSDPRGVLSEFGVELEDEVELRVLDSTADIRYLVIPRRPAGSTTMSEDELAALVTRVSMIRRRPAGYPRSGYLLSYAADSSRGSRSG
jgi:nitrile hydratase